MVFLLLLCDDKAVLGPWVNGRKLNALAGAIVWVLVLLSVVLTASVLFPHITAGQIETVLGAGVAVGLIAGAFLGLQGWRAARRTLTVPVEWEKRDTWRMPPLRLLAKPVISTQRKLGLITPARLPPRRLHPGRGEGGPGRGQVWSEAMTQGISTSLISPSAAQTADFAGRAAVALALGAFIGVERQGRQRMAGLRTNALVALGAALFVLFGDLLTGQAGVDPTRIAAYVVSGVGFLGAGVIRRDGVNVRGVNTAATIWCSAAVGVLAGGGYVVEAIIGAILVVAAHAQLRPVARRIDRIPATDESEVETIYSFRAVSTPPTRPTSGPSPSRPSPATSSSCEPCTARTSNSAPTWSRWKPNCSVTAATTSLWRTRSAGSVSSPAAPRSAGASSKTPAWPSLPRTDACRRRRPEAVRAGRRSQMARG